MYFLHLRLNGAQHGMISEKLLQKIQFQCMYVLFAQAWLKALSYSNQKEGFNTCGEYPVYVNYKVIKPMPTRKSNMLKDLKLYICLAST